jgi:Flp pilus assembly protein TadB
MVISDGIPAVPRNRKSRNSVPNPSAEEITTRNSVPWNKKGKNGSKLSEFRSEPFRRRENNSDFRSEEQKKRPTLHSGLFCREDNNSEQNAAAEHFKIVLVVMAVAAVMMAVAAVMMAVAAVLMAVAAVVVAVAYVVLAVVTAVVTVYCGSWLKKTNIFLSKP